MSDHPMDGLMPVTIGDKLVMARTIAESGMVPSSLDTPQKVFIALQMGHELGLAPMVAVNNISAINGRAVLSADLQVGIAKKHPSYAGMEVGYTGEGDALRCTVTVRRFLPDGGPAEESTASFSIAEAKEAGLFERKGPWHTYPKRMLKHRATAYAIRDAFPDLLAGLYNEHEIEGEDFSEVPRDVTPGPTATDQSNAILDDIARSIRERVEILLDEKLITPEEADKLLGSILKYVDAGDPAKLTDFRRYVSSRERKLREGKPKKAKPADPKPEDAEVIQDPESAPEDAKMGEAEKPAIGKKNTKVEKAVKGKTLMEETIERTKELAEQEQLELDPDDEKAPIV